MIRNFLQNVEYLQLDLKALKLQSLADNCLSFGESRISDARYLRQWPFKTNSLRRIQTMVQIDKLCRKS
ncbi:MAG: hypothetical protein EZS28_012313 [Streblomastix strix]|uniref:Uncharacterized protein n=1 Tax=Streblomastix strix TaxID=222440 RepID=A0A5J4WB91_9EUKA|nr:MAG: hypothetical protein EZS28_012313 [Streblomastix strix]